MVFSYRDLFCGGKTFCCCLPVRMGVIIMAFLGILFGGVLSIVLWFEVASAMDMTSRGRAAFVVAGLVETFLFVASIFGLVGAVVRKQVFVQIYAYFIYIHFILNIAVAGYLLFIVTRFSTNANVKACQDAIQNTQAQGQCDGLLKVAQGVYFVIAAIVLLVEMYGALIVTRYVNQVKNEKRSARQSRMDNEEAFRLVPKGKGARYSALPDGLERSIPSPPYTGGFARDFDPYEEVMGSNYAAGPSHAYDDGVPAHPVEVGYGGGSWTHKEISEEEKARLKKLDDETEILNPTLTIDDDEVERRRQEVKSPNGPPLAQPRSREIDDLPRYTLSDPPVPR